MAGVDIEFSTPEILKKALSIDDIFKIYYYECKTGIAGEQKAKDFWLFSYFANGMNPKDIAFLQWKNKQLLYNVFHAIFCANIN